MRRFGLAFGVLGFVALSAHAIDRNDFVNPAKGTAAVFLAGGDTVNSYVVSVSSDVHGAATLVRKAVSDRSRRRVCVQNQGSFAVFIGSSATTGGNKFELGESTNTAISSLFCTNSSAAIYGSELPLAAAENVAVWEEDSSNP